MKNAPIQVLIGGVQKGGTTSLSAHLGQHASLAGHRATELPYFVDPAEYERGWDQALRQHYRGRVLGDGQVRLAKSAGVMFLPAALDRVHAHNPNVRLLFMLREPVARSFSAYRYLVARGRETAPSFTEALALEPGRLATDFDRLHRFAYVGRGMYADQLGEVFKRFEPAQVRVIILEEFQQDPSAAVQETCDWLGIDRWPDEIIGQLVTARHNAIEMVGRVVSGPRWLPPSIKRLVPREGLGGRVRSLTTRTRSTPRLSLDPGDRERLAETFAEPNERLYELLGRRIPAWESPAPEATTTTTSPSR